MMRRLNIILVWHLYIFLLFAALLLLVFVPVYQYIADFTLRNELAHTENRMKQGIESVDAVITNLNNMISSTSADSRFRALKFRDSGESVINPYSLRELRDAINIPLLPYSLPADAGLVFPGGQTITRHGIFYYPDTVPFYGTFLQCGELSREEWTALLAESPSFIPARNYTSAWYPDYEAITFTAPWARAGFPDAVIFFAALPVQEIVSLIADTDAAGYICIYDAEGNILFSRETQSAPAVHAAVWQSPSSLLRYEIGISNSFIKEKMRPVKNRMLVFISLTAAFVLLLSFLFAWCGSRPERAFFERVSSTGIIRLEQEGRERKWPLSVFTGLKRTYHDLAENIYSATVRLETSLHTIENQTCLIRIQTIDKIRRALSSGNEAAACILLRDCATALPRPEAPLVTGLLAKMLSGMLRELTREYPGLLASVNIPEYTPGTEDKLFERQYPACFSQICEALRAHHEKNIPAPGREVLAYINEHLYNPALYITMAADHFGISAPTLQKLVKQCTGQTFLNYVEKRRLERACELLAGGRDNIVRIARSCGFSSANSFSRSFKRSYGLSPGKLRNSRTE
jgi:AraC-like DNA-binding protein